MPQGLEPLRQVEHLGDVLGRPGEDVGGQDVDQRLVLVEAGLVGIGDLRGRLRLQAGRDQHPVLATIEAFVPEVPDVGDVLDVEDRDAVVQERATDQVREQVAAEVPDVRPAVDGRAARVHAHGSGVAERDGLDASRERVAKGRSGRPGRRRRGIGHRAIVRRHARGRPGGGPRGDPARNPGRRAITKRPRARSPCQRPRRQHRSPGGVARRGLISCPATGAVASTGRPKGLPATRPYTPAVRRWVCIVALLAGFSGAGYAWSARPRLPVPIERLLDPRRPDPALPEGAWWRTT